MQRNPSVWLLVATVTAALLNTDVKAEAQNSVVLASDDTLEAVVVSARRVKERAQDVPVSLTALSAADLQRENIFQPSDLQSHVPGLVVANDITGGDAQPIFTIRGLGQEYGTEPTVLIYFNDAPADSRFVGNALYDLESVDVLRGPQGTLFGKNAVGGAVLFEPKQPTDEFDASVQSRFGNFDTRDYTGMVNIPLSEVAAVRIAGESIRANGWLRNTEGPNFNNKDHDSVRASFRLKPTSWLESTTMLQYFALNARELGGQLTSYVPCPTFTPNCLYSPPLTTLMGAPDLPAAFALQQALGARTVAVATPSYDKIVDRRVTNSTTFSLRAITIKNIVSFSRADAIADKTLTGTDVPIFQYRSNEKIGNTSDELQLQGRSLNDQLKWIIGGFFNNVTSKNEAVTNTFVSPLNPTNPLLNSINDGAISKAAFAQATGDLGGLVPGLSFTGGYRYTWDTRRESLHSLANGNCALQYGPNTPLAGSFYPFTNASCTRFVDAKYSADGYTYGFNYKVNDSVMIYVSRNKSYKAGGFNDLVVQPTFYSYRPEYIVDTELGLKSDVHLWNQPLRINIALYDSQFTNIQLEDVNIDPASGATQSFVFNGSSARIKGGELEITYLPINHLQLDASYTYDHGVYGNLISLATGTPVSSTGRSFAFLPRSTYRMAARYFLPIPDHWAKAALVAEYYHQDSVPGYASRPEGKLNETQPYGIGNARLDLTNIAGSPLDLSLYVKNLQNKLYQVFALDDTQILGYSSTAYGTPRNFGAQITYRFGASASP